MIISLEGILLEKNDMLTRKWSILKMKRTVGVEIFILFGKENMMETWKGSRIFGYGAGIYFKQRKLQF